MTSAEISSNLDSPRSPASSHGWLADLRRDVEAHPGVRHPRLRRRFSREQAVAFGSQHHALVDFFTTSLEALLVAAPSSSEKLWLAKVLVNEYGEGSDGKDHPTLYREFLRGAGADVATLDDTQLLPEVLDFVLGHLRLCRDEPFLVGLGALGPGHEWAIPHMFAPLVGGLRGAGVPERDLLYFTLHAEQDIDHGAWMEEVLAAMVRSDEQRVLVRRGALLSLDLRRRLWDAIARVLDEGRLASPADDAIDLRTLRGLVRARMLGGAPADHDITTRRPGA